MFTKIIEEKRWENLYSGINVTDFGLWIRAEVEYRHGQIEDLLVSTNKSPAVKVCSKNLINFLDLYGVDPKFDGTFTVVRKENNYNIKLKDLENSGNVTIRYECNSRQVLKPVTNLTKTIEAQRKLAGTSLNLREWQINDVTLIRALSQDIHNAILLLEPFSTSRLIKRLKSPEFRHRFKLIHPDTKFIKTEQPKK